MHYSSRFFRVCVKPRALRAPESRSRTAGPYEPFSRRTPLGFFSSTHLMSGIVRYRTPNQFSRLTRVDPLTFKARREEWVARLGRKIVEEKKAAEEWKARPWNLHEVVGPWKAGKVFEDLGKAYERDTSEEQRKNREKGRNGALPRVSAPSFRRSTEPRSIRETRLPPRSLHSRPFSSSSISTQFKLVPSSTPPLAQSYSTQTVARKNVLRAKFPRDTKIDLEQILKDFRDLELLESIKGVRPKSATGFKDSHRALYPLFHRFDQGEIPHVTFGDLDAALPELYSAAWTTIEQRLVDKKVWKLESLSKREKALLNLVALYSIGAKRAEVFVANGCRTAEDLIKSDQKGKIKLTKAQKIGLLHREDFNRLIPRDEMEELKLALETALKKAKKDFEMEILGSFRRGVGFSSDIDLVVRHKTFLNKDDEATAKPLMAMIVKQLEDDGLIERENQLMLGPKKYAGLMKLPDHRHYRRIDIRLAPYPSYPYMLLGSTGDALLMKLMRHIAKKKGWCLNEFGMGEKYAAEDENPNGFRPGTLKIVKSEREIFDLLGLPYLKPEQRDFSVWKQIFAKAGISGLDQLHHL
ncbi:hypothetical protein JCM3765_003447 [Sporobolomyces pararoseus]